MILVGTVAEIQSEYIRSSIEQATDNFRTRACRAEGGDDLGVAMTAHFCVAALTGRPFLGLDDKDGAEIVDIGQGGTGDDLVTECLEKRVPVVVG